MQTKFKPTDCSTTIICNLYREVPLLTRIFNKGLMLPQLACLTTPGIYMFLKDKYETKKDRGEIKQLIRRLGKIDFLIKNNDNDYPYDMKSFRVEAVGIINGIIRKNKGHVVTSTTEDLFTENSRIIELLNIYVERGEEDLDTDTLEDTVVELAQQALYGRKVL